MIELLLAVAPVADRCAYEGPAPLALDQGAFAASRSGAPLPAFDGVFEEALQKTKSQALGVAVYRAGQPVYERVHGIDGDQLFHWASIGKSALAVVTLQLVDEGKLELGTTLDRWYPDLPFANAITIADLLGHTSGIFVASEDPDTQTETKQGFADRGYFHCPGQFFKYSNAGYVRLAEIVEALEGRPWQDSLRARIILPLGLSQTIAIDASNAAAVRMPGASGQTPTTPGAAGGLAASPGDMAIYWGALMDGRLLPAALRDRMLDGLYPIGDGNSYYGQGAMVFETGDTGPPLIGHAGGMKGQNSIVFHSPADDVVIAVANLGPASAAAVAALYMQALRAD